MPIDLATPQPDGPSVGNVLFSQGEPARQVFAVVKGAVVVACSLAGGRRQILDVAGPGRVVGFTARATHECTAVALKATRVIAFNRSGGQSRRLEASELIDAALTEIDRLRRLVSLLGRMTAVERVATFLADLLDDGDGPQVVKLALSRQEMADHLGLAVETVSRGLFALKRRGVIARARRASVAIVDCPALRHIAAGGEAAGG